MAFLCRLVEKLGDGLVRGMTHVNLSPSPFRQMTATWLREQGDWTGSNAVKEDWVLLEGRVCEIARAEAHYNLQKARRDGTRLFAVPRETRSRGTS